MPVRKPKLTAEEMRKQKCERCGTQRRANAGKCSLSLFADVKRPVNHKWV